MAEKNALRDAAEKLIAKLDVVHAHPAYSGVWGFAQSHFGPYTGPQYKDELDALREAVNADAE